MTEGSMQEIERRLVADAALSRYATGSDKSFVAAYEFAEDGNEFGSAEEADAFITTHKEAIDWVYDHLIDILTDAVFKHEHADNFDDKYLRRPDGSIYGTKE